MQRTRNVAYIASTSAGDQATDDQAIAFAKRGHADPIGPDAHHLRRATLLGDGRWRIEHEWTWDAHDDPDELVYSTRTNPANAHGRARNNLPFAAPRGA